MGLQITIKCVSSLIIIFTHMSSFEGYNPV